jgi:hypothetical protein
MYDDGSPSRVPMPGKLKWVVGFVYFQVVSNILVGLITRSAINDALDHGQELANPPLAYFAEYVSFIAAVAQLIGAISVTSGRAWGRTLLVAVEALGIVIGIVSLINGTGLAALGLVLSALVITTLFKEDVRDWFDQKEHLRGRGQVEPSP